MAKENQDTVSEVDDVSPSESEIDDRAAGDDESAGSELLTETNFDDASDPAEAGEASEHGDETVHDYEREPVVSAPPSLAMWLSDELRPSPSKSVPPAALSPVDPPETLAPVAVPQTELSEEDLAVLPPGSRPGQSRSTLRTAVIVLLGAAAAVFLFSYARSPATGPQPQLEAAAQPVTADGLDQGVVPPSPPAPGDAASNEATSADEPATRGLGHGRWVPPASTDQAALDEEARLRGPSVGRFPDLPAEYWSELRRRELEAKAERLRQLANESLAP